jgi:F-type H+-transporting ATPase subunit delta
MSQFTTQARPYAKAAFETAVLDNKLGEWSATLGMLAAVLQQPKVVTYMSVPSRSASELANTLVGLCGSDISEKAANFVRLLAANKRLALIPQISVLYDQLKADRERIIDVDVVSAFTISDAAQQSLSAALKAKLQREVKLSTRIDQSLIGGVVIRAGDLVLDSSIRGKLNKLSETMNA